MAVDFEIGLFQGKDLFEGQQLPEAQDGGDELRDHRGQGHARHAHGVHQGDIQHDVEHRRDQQEAQGGQAVAQAPEHAGQDVVIEEARDAQEINIEVIPAAVVHAGQGAHGFQQGTCDQGTHDHDDHAGDGRHRDAVADGLGQGFAVPGPEILGHQDARAGGDAHKQRQQQVQHRHGVAHRAQGGVAPAAVAHHHGVHGVVQLLGKIADQHGEGELRDALPGRALAHVPGRKLFLQLGKHGHPPLQVS